VTAHLLPLFSPPRASPLQRPTTQQGYWSVSRSSHARLPHSGHHKTTAACSPETATAHNLETTAPAPPTTLRHPTRSAGTTGISGTKPKNAPHHTPASTSTPTSRGTPASRETPKIRKTPPSDVNGGCLHHQLVASSL
jgi:hypothetical protein